MKYVALILFACAISTASPVEIRSEWLEVPKELATIPFDADTGDIVQFILWTRAVETSTEDDLDELEGFGEHLMGEGETVEGDEPLTQITRQLHMRAHDALTKLFDDVYALSCDSGEEELYIDFSNDVYRRAGRHRKRKVDPVTVLNGVSVVCLGLHHLMPDKHGLPIIAKAAEVGAQIAAYKLSKRAARAIERAADEEDEDEVFAGLSQEEIVETMIALAAMLQAAQLQQITGKKGSIDTKHPKHVFDDPKEQHRFTYMAYKVEPALLAALDGRAEETLATIDLRMRQS